MSFPCDSSNQSRTRSKRLRLTEETVAVDGSSALGSSKKKNLGPPGPKVRKSVAASASRDEEKEKKKAANSKHSQSQNPVQLSGKSLNEAWDITSI